MGLFSKKKLVDPVQEALDNKKAQEAQRKQREEEALKRKLNIKKKRKSLESTLAKIANTKENIEKTLVESKLNNNEKVYQLQKRAYIAVLSRESKMQEFIGLIDVMTEMHDMSSNYQDFIHVVRDISKDMVSLPEMPNIEDLNQQIDLGVANLNDMTKTIENLMGQMDTTTESFFENQDNTVDEDEIDKLVNDLIQKDPNNSLDDTNLLNEFDEIDQDIKKRLNSKK